MPDLVSFTLDDGTAVAFETDDDDFVRQHGGDQEIDGGRLTARLRATAQAAQEVADELRAKLAPDKVTLEFGLKVSGEANWFFAKSQAEGTIKVTVEWAGPSEQP